MLATFKRARSFVAFGAALVVSAASALAAPELRYAFKPDQALKYRVTTDLESSADRAGVVVKTGVHMVLETAMRVQRVDDQGTATVEVRYTAMKVSIDGGDQQGKVDFDSSNPAKSDERMAELGQMVDKPFTLVMERTGKVREVKGLREIMPASPVVEHFFGDEQMKAQFQQWFYFLPDNAATEVGQTWTRTYDQDPLRLSNEFTLASAGENQAVIEMKTSMVLSKAQIADTTVKLNEGRGSSTIVFDTAQGALKSAASTTHASIHLSHPSQGEVAQTATSTTKMERVE